MQWAGFTDPQTGIQEFWWCVGLAPGRCDVTNQTRTMLSRATHRAGLNLPLATPLYVTVRARNPAGLDTVSVSDSFTGKPALCSSHLFGLKTQRTVRILSGAQEKTVSFSESKNVVLTPCRCTQPPCEYARTRMITYAR